MRNTIRAFSSALFIASAMTIALALHPAPAFAAGGDCDEQACVRNGDCEDYDCPGAATCGCSSSECGC